MKRLIIWSIIGTGISSIAVQLITVREFLSQFQGNEITISLVLFCWLLLTGLGSLFARTVRRSSLTLYALLCIVIALWPLLMIISIREFRETVFIHGVSPGFYQIFFYILVTITPYCFLVGFILPYALKVLHDKHVAFTSGELYITDNIGDIMGGILFSFVLVYFLKPFKAIALTSGLLVLVGLVLLLSYRQNAALLFAILATMLFAIFSLNGSFEISTLSGQYGDIVRYMESPYGRIVVTKEGPQHTFWESGVPLYSEANVISSEEKIHYPLSQLEKVEKVLLISGGLGETLGEISKYHPKQIDYVELDPILTGAARDLGFIKESPSLSIMNTDGRRYVKETTTTYDAIIVDLPDPETFQINRFFTSEFFAFSKKALSEGGVLSFGITYSQNYISEIRKKKLSTLYNTARAHFKNVLVLPGQEAYFICRDGALSEDIPARLKGKSIKTSYIAGFYQGNVTRERIGEIREILDDNEYINTDFEPRIMNIVFQEWFMKYGTSPKAFLLIFFGLTIIYLFFMKREEYILFSTGLATMGVEMLVIFSFQVIYGYIYLKIGAIITAFLLGLLPGAILGNFFKQRNRLDLIISDIILLFLLLTFAIWIIFFKNALHQFYFLAYCLVFSFFCGYQFPAAMGTIGEDKSPAAGCLAADLSGAAVGTVATGTLLIPLGGVQSAIIFLILVKISSNIMILFEKKRGA